MAREAPSRHRFSPVDFRDQCGKGRSLLGAADGEKFFPTEMPNASVTFLQQQPKKQHHPTEQQTECEEKKM